MLDKNTNPFREDLAAEKLRDIVDAPKYVVPVRKQIISGSASIDYKPEIYSDRATEGLAGEYFDVYEEKDGYSWGQLSRDNYVGYIKSDQLSNELITPNRKIKALRTYGFSIPKVQGSVVVNLSMNALVTVGDVVENGFVDCGIHGWIYEKHLSPLNEYFNDPAGVALQFVGAPYYWGGVQSYGLDCSGLVQTSFAACGVKLPRDAYMQEKEGVEIAIKDDLSGLKRNDLIFWKGHVGIMLDAENFVHANGWHMATAVEKLADTNARYLQNDLVIRSIRRVI